LARPSKKLLGPEAATMRRTMQPQLLRRGLWKNPIRFTSPLPQGAGKAIADTMPKPKSVDGKPLE